ncbi:MAG: hypothetical protein M1817_000057 [Caeruleum heppii]|nr:MAG: hypothetical protein M1817_000057 [Caeruleum heppii]
MEAISFRHYCTSQRLLNFQEASSLLSGRVQLTIEDYILGIFDLVGELMRYAITNMATSGHLSRGELYEPGETENHAADASRRAGGSDVLRDLRSLRIYFESLNISSSGPYSGLGSEVDKKMEVMRTCVEKVENAVYGLIIRGRERPPGWIPDMKERTSATAEVVESG